MRYRLLILVASNELLVEIEALHKTKATLRRDFSLAKRMCEDGELVSAEAWDTKTNGRLASAGGARKDER